MFVKIKIKTKRKFYLYLSVVGINHMFKTTKLNHESKLLTIYINYCMNLKIQIYV